MAQQAFKNHSRISPLYHGLTLLALIAYLILAIRYCINEGIQTNSLLALVAWVILFSLYYHARTFALVAQDRAIRAEERLRHYLLTGRPMDSQLRLGQIIALRFASDEELPTLAQRAVTENLSANEIKKSIENWRADTHRV